MVIQKESEQNQPKNTIQKELIERLNNLSVEQLQLVANLIDQIELDSDANTISSKEAKAMEKWEYLLKHHHEMNDDDPLSNEEIEMVRNVLHRQGKNRPTGLAKEEIFIADDFDAPLPDDIIDLFYQ